MKQASNVDLPETLFVRWQSLVEPQTYKLRIDIPQWVRDEMLAAAGFLPSRWRMGR